jgi:GDPmannose 4,6-dehydratase
MRTVLITGITGQDGSYLARLLLDKGYRVVGTVRNERKAADSLQVNSIGGVELIEWNMLDQAEIVEALSRHRPDELYNYAGYSSGAGMFDDPVGIGEINGLAVTRILDAIREVDPAIRFCQASSREIFGEATESPQTERTSLFPRSPYGAAKLYADNMIRIYRRHHKLFACSAILFNHESPLRGLGFVTRKITHEAARIKLGLSNELRLGNLDTSRDWGFAGDYVQAMWLMLQEGFPDDYVVATGEAHTVREFCEIAFEYLGLDYREFVREDASTYRPSEPVKLIGNADKARQTLKWKPQVCFRELVSMMVEADYQKLNALAKAN